MIHMTREYSLENFQWVLDQCSEDGRCVRAAVVSNTQTEVDSLASCLITYAMGFSRSTPNAILIRRYRLDDEPVKNALRFENGNTIYFITTGRYIEPDIEPVDILLYTNNAADGIETDECEPVRIEPSPELDEFLKDFVVTEGGME